MGNYLLIHRYVINMKFSKRSIALNNNGGGGYTRHNKIWQRKTHLIDHYQQEKLISENHAIMMYVPYLKNNED